MSRRRKKKKFQAQHINGAALDIEQSAPAPSGLYIREVGSEDDLIQLHMLLLIMGQEAARVPVNPRKVMQQLMHCAQNPDVYTMLLTIEDDHLIGAMCLMKTEYWYGDDFFLSDLFLYVLPAKRDGRAMKELKDAAAAIGTAADMQVFITINNPKRRRHSGIELAGSVEAFHPSGAILALGAPSPSIN